MLVKTKVPAPLSTLSFGSVQMGNHLPFVLIAGPCIMESKRHLWKVAEALQKIAREVKIHLIFKCSYDKANRTSFFSYRGPGKREGLSMLAEIKEKFKFPILTDVHLPEEAPLAAEVADILQVPAFLCRQTDLVIACAKTGKAVNLKKGQFLSPWESAQMVEKVLACGNRKVLLTERGTSFGYNNLVVDMRGIEVMKKMHLPVIFDATHSVQLPGGQGDATGGQREFAFPLARAAVAVGVAAVFMEVHPHPDRALSDGPNSIQLRELKSILKRLIELDRVTKGGGGG